MSKNMKAKWRIQNAWLAVLIAGLIWSLCTVYELPVNPVTLFLWMGAVWGVLLLPKIVQGVLGFPLIVYILLYFLGKLDRGNFLEKGWEQLYAGIAIRYHVHMKLPLPGGLRSIPGAYDASLLLKVAGVFVFVILAYACRGWFGYILTLLCMAAVVGLELYHGRAPEVPAMICIFSGCIGLISLRKAKDAPRRKVAMQLLFLTAAFCAGGLVLHTWGDPFLARHKEILSRQKQVEKQIVQKTNKILRKLSKAIPGKEIPGKGVLELSMSGNVDMHEITYRGSEVMEITTGRNCDVDKYLRGFVGNEYRDGQWSYDGKPFEHWLNTQGGLENPAQFIYGQEYYGSDYDEKQYWKIEYLNIPDDFAYLPYGCNFMKMGKNVQYHKDGSVDRKEDTLQFEVALHGDGKPWLYAEDYTKEEYAEILEECDDDELEMWNNLSLSAKWLQDYYFDMVQADVNLQIPEDVGALFEKYAMSEGLYEIWEQLSNVYMGFNIEDMNEKELEEIREYMGAARIWPDVREDKLVQMRKLRTSTKIFLIQKYLRQYTAYTKKPNGNAEGETVLEQFLFTGRTGYCVHFATAGAMLLRYLGVPARYVTGYRVSPERFGIEEDGKRRSRVLDSDAHAWVEIYDTVEGWVPVDFTDGVTELDSVSPLPDSTQPSEQTEAPEITEEPSSTPTSEPTPTEKPKETQTPSEGIPGGTHGGDGIDGGGGTKIAGITFSPWMFRLFSCLAGMAILFFLYFVTMKLRGHFRKRKRYQKDSRQAVLATTWQMMWLLRHLGIKENPAMTDMAFADYVEKSLDFFEEGELKRMMELAGKAAYCEDGMDREDAYFCRQIYDKTLQVCRERCHVPGFCL